ncbi:MAG TPA: hypothetical protein VFB79_14865, partial [Candidatus Angelobacter sp.]|nr:hypothetical protein [Candidatus Angelobacter sp.]
MSDAGNTSLLRCSQPGCTFDVDGVCLEGLPAGKDCPHRIRGIAEGDTESAEESLGTAEKWISLPDGYELSLESTFEITRASNARLIVLAGEADAGKTTLISCVFEQFSEGMYAEHKVAWSDTVLAFERICYRSRISSEAEKADTVRTKGLSPRFFHLQLQSNESGIFSDLLVTDVSGEAYRRALNNQEDALNLGFIKRADAFVLLLDGERLASKEFRQDAFRRGLLLLKALLQAKVLSSQCPIRVLVAKYDLLVPGKVDKNTSQFVEYVEAEYKKFGDENFTDFQILRVASRPNPGSSLEYGFGIEAVLKDWVKEHTEPIMDFKPKVDPASNERESARYLWRQL